jgi:squalene cyclase
MTTTTNELTNGRWLGQRGIFRHYVPAVEDINPEPGEFVFHTVSTSVADWAGVHGELVRCVGEGEVLYEARIDGTEDHCGLSDVAAYSLDTIAALAKVANDLRYEWEQITGRHKSITWSVL